VDFSVKSVELPNELRLQYVEQGESSGVPVLLLHGLTDSWRSFERVMPHIPGSVHCFSITQRGHGDASRPEMGYRPVDFSEDIAAFMDAVHLDSAVIAGHSSHSFVAQRFAIDHPERTLGLVLIGAPATLSDKPGLQEMRDSIAKLTDPIDQDFVRRFVESTVARSVPKAFYEAMVEETLKVPARVWRAAFEGILTHDLSGERQLIKAPTLIIWGDQDGICTLHDQEILAAEIEDSELLVYAGTGHTPHWEEPERFASDIAAFALRGSI
jgi:non-heme chloroperoxidase